MNLKHELFIDAIWPIYLQNYVSVMEIKVSTSKHWWRTSKVTQCGTMRFVVLERSNRNWFTYIRLSPRYMAQQNCFQWNNELKYNFFSCSFTSFFSSLPSECESERLTMKCNKNTRRKKKINMSRQRGSDTGLRPTK